MVWTGSPEDLESWLACDDTAITQRAQKAKRDTIVASGGEIG